METKCNDWVLYPSIILGYTVLCSFFTTNPIGFFFILIDSQHPRRTTLETDDERDRPAV